MSDQGQRSEQPTKRRLDKARKEGRFPVSREFVSSLHFLAFVWIFVTWSGQFLDRIRVFTRLVLAEAFHMHVDRVGVVKLYREALFDIFLPLLLAGACLTMLAMVGQLGTTQFGFSFEKLTPDFTRLNPIRKLADLPKQGFASLTQAVLLLPIFGYAAYRIAANSLDSYLSLPGLSVEPAFRVMAESYKSLLWKAGFVLFLIGFVDFVRQRNKHSQSLRMTKQEVKEEAKEMEGNPQIKQKIRRIQRDMARKSMLKEVPKATAIIVNPTHYSVAIRYEMETMAAPRVLAKGKNLIARRIREIALEHQIPIVENEPLAQALYKSADVGQEIPPHLYRAVAEILAYLFKLMNQGRN